MNRLDYLILISFVFLSGCEPNPPITITIIDNGQIRTMITSNRIPETLLTQAGVILGSGDSVLLNGYKIPLDQLLSSAKSYTLQIQRAATLNINGRIVQSSAQTLGEVLSDMGTSLYINDKLDPPADTPITGAMTIKYIPSQDLIVTMDKRQIHIRSSTQTIDAALAEAGLSLTDLDLSQPPANESLPQDGQIHLIRVSESIILAQKSIPYESQTIDSPEIALGQQEILKPGEVGLSVSRTRIRYEDGKEVKRVQDVESIVRTPQTRVIATGTRIVINSTTIDGVTFQFWRSMKMYATSYSPCRSGVPGQCFDGTKSGLPLQKGVIAVDPSTYNYLVGQKVFIPGYGNAVVGDIGGGYIIEKELGIPRELWIDLGYADSNYQEAPGWVTVYFLVPAPATIPAFMK